jgi:hypothetical protein
MDKSIPGGVLTQENMSTGEVKKIAQPSGKAVGKRFYDANGNLIYEEGDLKTIPAAQAEKQASLITAMANLDEMDKLMSAGEQEGVDMTGFWEITNKYVDNWNLLDKQSLKRADLRQRVAMSLKFMYDVMGASAGRAGVEKRRSDAAGHEGGRGGVQEPCRQPARLHGGDAGGEQGCVSTTRV